MATALTNTPIKPILVIKSPQNSSKPSLRNVHFVPDILVNDEKVILSRIFSN